jgi:hypothetical protein
MGVNQQSNQEIVMKRNSKVLSVITAAVIALLAAGCVSVPGDYAEDHVETFLPVDRGTGS